MRLPEACQQASRLNEKQEASGTSTRFVVVAEPIGSCGGDYTIVARKVRSAASRSRSRR